ncbi:MAG: hypothetical protein J0L88_08340 [Xanthomonadales bacterium]|nr:hypothetical protein [Xanthomonadales bacterium]
MRPVATLFAAALACLLPRLSTAAESTPLPSPVFDAALAGTLGADEYGMRKYVLVILKTGSKAMPKGPERDAMFKGHFANMKRLADEGKLAVAGPLDGVDGWRGLFILAVADIEEAKKLVATDPVIANGEMVAEYHTHYGSAALMQVNDVHARIARKGF